MHFLAILGFGVGFNLASMMDGKKGEATSATVGYVWFPVSRPEQTVCGVFGDPKARVIRLNRRQKNRLRLLRSHPDGLVRSQVCRVRDLSCGDTRISELEVRRLRLSQLRQGEARAARLSGGQSALHQALCLLRRPALSICDDQDIAADLRLDWHTVKTLDQQYMQAQLARAGRPGPQVIGIDEIAIHGHASRIVVSDLFQPAGRSGLAARTARRRASSEFYVWLGAKRAGAFALR